MCVTFYNESWFVFNVVAFYMREHSMRCVKNKKRYAKAKNIQLCSESMRGSTKINRKQCNDIMATKINIKWGKMA